MRIALVIGSAYEKNTQLLPLPSADLDCELLARVLGEPEADFRVTRLTAERGLAERLEQRLAAQTEPIDELFIYFSGYCVLSEERGPALLLDGERLGTLSLPRLRKLLESFARSSCVLVDAAAVVDADQNLEAVVASLGAALAAGSPSVSVLAAARNSDSPDSFGGSAFTGLVLMVLDWLLASRDAEQPIDVRRLYDGLRADAALWEAIPAVGLFPESPDFVLLPPASSLTRRAGSSPAAALELPTLPRHSPPPPPPPPLSVPARHHSPPPPPPPPLSAPARHHSPPPPPPPLSAPPSRGALSAPPPPVSRLPPLSPLPAPSVSPPPSSSAGKDGRRGTNLDDLDSLLGMGSPGQETDEPAPESVTPVRSGEFRLPSFADAAPDRPSRSSSEALPLPSFGGSTSSADELFAEGLYERAAEEYEAAFVLLDDPRERAGALARWARALARLERLDEAARHVSAAHALDPAHADVLAMRAELAAASGDAAEALRAAEAWLALAPNHADALRLLANAAEELGDVKRAVEARCRLARYSEGSAEEKAGALFEASASAEQELGDRTLALELAMEAFSLMPGAPHIASRVGALVEAHGTPQQLFSHYESALAQATEPAAIADLVTKLDRLSNAIGDPSRAARCLERLVGMRPADLALRDRLVELYAAGAAREHALAHCRVAARLSPTRASTYRHALALFEAEGALDGAWLAASVLDSLGEADINEALLASQHKPEGLLAARGTIGDAEWQSALWEPDGDRELWSVLAALGAAAARVGVGFAKHTARHREPDPTTREDVEKSTTMLAKTLGWSARLLGLAPPALYLIPELESGLDVATTELPSALVSRTLGSGLGLGELAFLWGRHLPRFREELRALAFFRTEEELGALVLAALALGSAPGIELRELDGDIKRLYAALRREVRGSELERLQRAARDVPLPEVYVRARQVLSSLELVGVRAGLVACGDVGVAAELLKRFPTEGFTRVQDQLDELYAFAISEQYALLRQRIGVAVGG